MKSFLMLGQSNTASRGDFGEMEEINNPLCKMFRNGKWISMSEPINPDRAIFAYFHSSVGLVASFPDKHANYFNEKNGLIPCADSGTAIKQWQPNDLLFDNAVSQAKLAQRTSEIARILWHQGESDSHNIEDVELYRERFFNLCGLTCKNDDIHFNSKSYREFGKRYFQSYLQVVRK